MRERLLPGALAGLSAGWVAATLPFYPSAWPVAIGAVAGAVGFAAPRAGLAFALATAFFPLANISLGLALVYAALAVGWLALTWRDPRTGLLVAAGPLLAPLGALAFLPLVVQAVRGRFRRAAHAWAAVVIAAVAAGVSGARLPFDGSTPPAAIGIAGSERPAAVAHALWAELAAHPILLAEAAVAAVAAALLPLARRRGPWPAAVFGAGLLAASALIAPAAAFAPLAAAAWATAAVLAVEPTD